MTTLRAFAPGRVNLIGDHTDTTGGLVLPMAIDLGTTVEGAGTDTATIELTSDDEADVAVVPAGPGATQVTAPAWARYVAGVVAEMVDAGVTVHGFRGEVRTTLPVGAGLSSSAALEVAVALALGADRGDARALAALCQRAEQRASGVPCGIMDQLASAAGVAGHALLIDCHDLSIRPVPLPPDVDVVVVHSGLPRTLAGSAYADRRRECEAAEALIGPLRLATAADAATVPDPVLRARARHVVTENERVRVAAAALAAGDLPTVGEAMAASHASLRDDFAVSVPAVDSLVERLAATPGVIGARMTGGGFGGCVVALARPGSLHEGWTVRAADGARVEVSGPR